MARRNYTLGQTMLVNQARIFENKESADAEAVFQAYRLDCHYDTVTLETAQHDDKLMESGNVWHRR
jgi:hypothetical protein